MFQLVVMCRAGESHIQFTLVRGPIRSYDFCLVFFVVIFSQCGRALLEYISLPLHDSQITKLAAYFLVKNFSIPFGSTFRLLGVPLEDELPGADTSASLLCAKSCAK